MVLVVLVAPLVSVRALVLLSTGAAELFELTVFFVAAGFTGRSVVVLGIAVLPQNSLVAKRYTCGDFFYRMCV